MLLFYQRFSYPSQAQSQTPSSWHPPWLLAQPLAGPLAQALAQPLARPLAQPLAWDLARTLAWHVYPQIVSKLYFIII